MKTDICVLCRQHNPLCKSHVIPNSIFRGIFKKASGKAIALSSKEDTPIAYSQESYASRLLCKSCEQKIDLNYEKYSLNVLRGIEGKTSIEEKGVKFKDINTKKIRDFIATIIWRAHHSENDVFRIIKIKPQQQEEMRLAFLINNPLSNSSYKVIMYKLRDSTSNGFSNESFRDYMMTPFIRKNQFGRTSYNSYVITLLGYFFELFIPPVGQTIPNNSFHLCNKTHEYLCPYIEILDIPEIVQVLGRNIEKQKTGLSNISS